MAGDSMNKYNVKVTSIRKGEIEVSAKDEKEAIEKAKQKIWMYGDTGSSKRSVSFKNNMFRFKLGELEDTWG